MFTSPSPLWGGIQGGGIIQTGCFMLNPFTFLQSRNLTLPEIAILQPADPFLDTAGEALRRRIFLSEGESGEALCLRPEFTIPVCRHHIASHANTPARYGYCGTVFRQRREGGSEFTQAGIEDLGDADEAAADARCVGDAINLLAELKPGFVPNIVLGDEGLFVALLAALDLAPVWQARLTRLFGDSRKLAEALQNQTSTASNVPFEGLDAHAILARIEVEMDSVGLLDSGGRTPEEITARLMEKRVLAVSGISDKAKQTIAAFLAIDTRLDHAEIALQQFEKVNGVKFGGALMRFSARLNAMRDAIIDPTTITFRAAFGRPLDYYSAMQFEIYGASPLPLIGGGRYNHLMTLLGAPKPIPAVGFSMWQDRVEAIT
jgi:ATP phosphoribosyltransferase regulatory subunit